MRRSIAATLGLALALTASPAFARHHRAPIAYPPGYFDYQYGAPAYPQPQASFPVDRALAERCGLHAGSVNPYPVPAYYDGRRRSDGLGGALIGGAVGGVVGNRVAGHDHRVAGTAVGAAVGAVAGATIDRADDRGAAPVPYAPGVDYADECANVLPVGYTLVSVPGGTECHDEVVTHEEWEPEHVTEPTVRRAPPLRDKRTKLRRIK